MERSIRAGRSFPTLMVLIAISVSGCGGSGSRLGSTDNSGAPVQVTTQSSVTKIAALCAQGRQRITSIPRPTTQDPSSPDAIRYEKAVAVILDQTVAKATALARSGQSPGSLNNAFAVEQRGQKLVDAQVPALERHDVAGAQRLAEKARVLTAPADAEIRRAGLGVCVGP